MVKSRTGSIQMYLRGKMNQSQSQSLRLNHSPTPSPNPFLHQSRNPPDLRMNSRLSQVFARLSLSPSPSPSPSPHLDNRLVRRMTFYLETHQSSVQKIPGIIKWNSPTISVIQCTPHSSRVVSLLGTFISRHISITRVNSNSINIPSPPHSMRFSYSL